MRKRPKSGRGVKMNGKSEGVLEGFLEGVLEGSMIDSSMLFRINRLGAVPTPRNIASFQSAIVLPCCVRKNQEEASEKHTVNRQEQLAKIGQNWQLCISGKGRYTHAVTSCQGKIAGQNLQNLYFYLSDWNVTVLEERRGNRDASELMDWRVHSEAHPNT
jgi:hypothetical protein